MSIKQIPHHPETCKSGGLLIMFVVLLCLVSCSTHNVPSYPQGFKDFTDSEKIEWLLERTEPDSMGRLLCNMAIYQDTIFHINNFPEAIRKVYAEYNDSARIIFGQEINRYADSLPPQLKMRIYMLAVNDNPYKLGVLYAEDCIKNSIDPSLIDKERFALKEICSDDTLYYYKFLAGMNSVKKIQSIYQNEKNFRLQGRDRYGNQ